MRRRASWAHGRTDLWSWGSANAGHHVILSSDPPGLTDYAIATRGFQIEICTENRRPRSVLQSAMKWTWVLLSVAPYFGVGIYTEYSHTKH
jgi:hypothetical protein